MWPTLDEILAATSFEALLGLEREAQENLYAEAIAAIERHCRQRFASEGDGSEGPVTRYFDGSGQTTLYLDRRLSLLTGLAANGSALDPESYSLGVGRNRLSWSGDGFGSWADRAVAEVEFGTRPTVFPVGHGNIAITGVWGWPDEEFPESLGRALGLAVEDFAAVVAGPLHETIAAARMEGIGSISQGGLSLDLSNRELDLSRRVKRLLAAPTPSGESLLFPIGAGVVV
jgi:hypothetical protein